MKADCKNGRFSMSTGDPQMSSAHPSWPDWTAIDRIKVFLFVMVKKMGKNHAIINNHLL